MLYARITAAVVALAGAAFVPPHTVDAVEVAVPSHDPIEVRVAGPVEPLEAVEAIETIDGVRIVSDDSDQIAMAREAVETFGHMGWPITNTEIRFEIDGCDHAGYHTIERGHHVVVICNESAWTLNHELGHVWSDLHLEDEDRQAFLERRSLDSWDQGAYDDRGTEQVAQIIAFGLHDRTHVPGRMGARGDYRSLVEDFEWLFGALPLHRGTGSAERATTGHESHTRVQVVAPRTIVPAEAPAIVEPEAHSIAAEYRFPVACGYPRWHSANGGYGYEDPRDWTHVGVDLYAHEGTPVVAPAQGTIVEAGWNEVAGWKVVMEDRFGYRHRLVHLASAPLVIEGMRVSAGQHVGDVGRSGNAAGGGPHLHYEIRKEGVPIDPMPWLRRTDGHHVARAPTSLGEVRASSHAACNARA